MKLEIIDRKVRQVHSIHQHETPVLTAAIGNRRGQFTLSQCLRKTIGAERGDVILVAFDADEKNWYLGIKKEGEGVQLRATGSRNNLVADYMSAVKMLLNPLGVEFARFLVIPTPKKDENGQNWFKIISRPLYSDK